jgi:hypothetical protein
VLHELHSKPCVLCYSPEHSREAANGRTLARHLQASSWAFHSSATCHNDVVIVLVQSDSQVCSSAPLQHLYLYPLPCLDNQYGRMTLKMTGVGGGLAIDSLGDLQ